MPGEKVKGSVAFVKQAGRVVRGLDVILLGLGVPAASLEMVKAECGAATAEMIGARNAMETVADPDVDSTQ